MFSCRNKKNIYTFGLKKASYQELCSFIHFVFSFKLTFFSLQEIELQKERAAKEEALREVLFSNLFVTFDVKML